jgi:hypothetical protein
MAETAVQYFTRICKEAGKSEADTAALVALAQDQSIAPKFDELIRRGTDDFAAMQGRATAADTKLAEAAAKLRKYDDEWYPKANAEYQKALAKVQELQAVVDGQGGDPGGGFDSSKFITKDDLAAMNKDRDARYATVIKQATRLASRHAAKYGEELDVDAVEALAVKNNLTLDQAYRDYVAPREMEAQTAKFEKEKKEFAEQAVKDYASRNRLPVDPVPHETAPVFRQASNKAPADMDAELIAAWNGATGSR